MYIKRMKIDQKGKASTAKAPEPMEVKVSAVAYKVDEPAMVRTQIYLSRREHDFLQSEGSRRGQPMAAIIRAFIDEKMDIPDWAWKNNPLLQAPVTDRVWEGREDGAANHDHYIYGTPKKWRKRHGQWVEAPPLPEDYYSNPERRRQYDEEAGNKK